MKKGLKCCKNNFPNILRNPFYIGKLKVKGWRNEKEEIVQGLHKPIIEEVLFREVQEVLDGKRKKTNTPYKVSEEMVLRGYLYCSKCGGKLTGGPSTSRNKSIHFYYECQHCRKERYRADVANPAFIEYLASIQVPQEISELYYMILRDRFADDDKGREEEQKDIETQIAKLNERLESVEDKFLDGEIDKTSFDRMRNGLEDRKGELIMKHNQLGGVFRSFDKYLKFALPALSNIKSYYLSVGVEIKRKIIGSIFTGKLVFLENNYRTSELNSVLALILNNTNSLGKSKKRAGRHFDDLPIKAPPRGLEPRTP